MQEVPGRLWDGKEVVLEALGDVIAIEPHCIQPEEDVITALLGELTLLTRHSPCIHENLGT